MDEGRWPELPVEVRDHILSYLDLNVTLRLTGGTWASHQICKNDPRRQWMSAARRGDLKVMRWLLAHYPDGFYPSVLTRAAYFGHLDIVKAIVEAGVGAQDDIESLHSDAMTYAGAQGHLPIVEYLYHQSKDDHIDVWGASEMAKACRQWHVDAFFQVIFKRRRRRIRRALKCDDCVTTFNDIDGLLIVYCPEH